MGLIYHPIYYKHTSQTSKHDASKTLQYFTEKEKLCACDSILYNNPFVGEPYKAIQFKVHFTQRKTPGV